MTRLAPSRLNGLPKDIARPLCDRSALTHSLLHLGNGAFHRCHLAEHTGDALHARFAPWGIRAVTLAPPDLGPQLGPQRGLYIRELREGQARDRRVIGALPDHLTVTEKGCCHIPSNRRADQRLHRCRSACARTASGRGSAGGLRA